MLERGWGFAGGKIAAGRCAAWGGLVRGRIRLAFLHARHNSDLGDQFLPEKLSKLQPACEPF
jgi:hypothetical protein